MNRKEILKNKLNISAILFNNNVPVDEAKIIGTFIEDLEQQVEKQQEVIDKIATRLEYFLIGNLKYQSSQDEFIKLLNILNEVSE
jgi:hypothetical protein